MLKGNGTRQIQNNHALTWSGVNTRERAIHGVAVIVQPDRAKKVLETDFVSERIVKIRLKYEHRNETITQIYAPCNDTFSDEEKAEFFEKLSGTTDSVPDNDDLFIMGDFNGRVGPRRTPWETYLGPHSDTKTECNYNGEHLLALCAEHGLLISNTFYNHRLSQRQTWYKSNDLGVSSQIDFILTRAKDRRNTTDARAIPNISLDTDHRPVIMTLKQKMWKNKRAKHRPEERIKLRVLNEKQTE